MNESLAHIISKAANADTQTHFVFWQRLFEACFMTCTYQTLPNVLTTPQRWFLWRICDCNLWCLMCWRCPLAFQSPTHSILLCLSARLEEASTVSERGSATDLVTQTWVSSFLCLPAWYLEQSIQVTWKLNCLLDGCSALVRKGTEIVGLFRHSDLGWIWPVTARLLNLLFAAPRFSRRTCYLGKGFIRSMLAKQHHTRL